MQRGMSYLQQHQRNRRELPATDEWGGRGIKDKNKEMHLKNQEDSFPPHPPPPNRVFFMPVLGTTIPRKENEARKTTAFHKPKFEY